jgi:hypothetical protein
MKLYWRVKLDGKWTWRPAKIKDILGTGRMTVYPLEEEE